MVSTAYHDDAVMLYRRFSRFAVLQRHAMKQVVPWTRRDEHEGITAMNARHMRPQLHTNLIALVRRT